ncbi:MAG: homoserine O-acetyltransferase [Bacteroidetes bacterium]|jgi:homoserine O-acetyltransferase|nr:homoserine O-acetyltransferase [Bacteroidota bacterium]
MSLQHYKHEKAFHLEGGGILPSFEIAYHTYGTLNTERSNVIWVCHALTANSDVLDWWKGLFGENNLFDPKDYFIVCANNLGSCYGTTGPLSVNEDIGQPWYAYFPEVTIRDMVNAHEVLRVHLGIEKINTIIGGSQGGQQVLEWNILQPELFENTIVVATNAKHSAWGIAFNEAQRLAIKADRTYYANLPDGGSKGLQAARAIALLSYRGYETFTGTQTEKDNEKTGDYKASSYQRHQGQKLVKRFNAYSYVILSQAMDSHNVGRNRGSLEKALEQITARTLVIGIKNDLLFPVSEQWLLTEQILNAEFAAIDSFYGHDGFLIETEKLTNIIASFLVADIRTNAEILEIKNMK